VVFVLATTEVAKVPATIASRCQRFKFRPISVDSLREHLANLAAKEKIAVAPEALELLARSAEGSLRDAVSLLDQCRSFTDKAVTAELVREMFGYVPADMLLGLAKALTGGDGAALGALLRQVYEEGVEPAQLLKDLRAGLQGVYLERVGLSGRGDKVWSEALSAVSPENLRYLLERANKTLEDLRFADSPRLTLELGLFGCLEAAGDLAAWVKRLEDLERRLTLGSSMTAGALAPAPAQISPSPAASPRVARTEKPASVPAPAATAGEKVPSAQLWPKLVAAVREEKPSLASILESARPVLMPDGSFKVLCARAFDAEQVKRGCGLIEAKLATIFGSVIRVAVEVGQPGARGGEAVETEVPEQSGTAPDGGVWKDVTEPSGKPAKGSTSLSRAEKILGGTSHFIKKKPSA
jgi:DNA polymerase-3 subunit gamma/tau